MGLSRSTFYDAPGRLWRLMTFWSGSKRFAMSSSADGYWLVGAALRHQGVVVNNKKLRRLMRQA